MTSKKHANRYINEFSLRLNKGHCEIDTQDGMNNLFGNMFGKTITYKELNDNKGIDNCITVATRGNDYFSCYQDGYTVTIVRTLLLYADRFKLNKYIALYTCALLRMNQYKCAYGKVLSGERIKLEKISLPANNKGNPDWKFMENHIKSLPYSSNL